MPFKDSTPTKCFLKNNRSALNNPEFVDSAILQLLKDGKIEEQSSPSFCVNPLSVVEGKKKRLVLDLRHVNKFLHKPKFRYENLDSLSQVFEKGDWFFNWDLKSGYHRVNIYQPHQKYLGFSWVINGVERYFVFTVLPFGLSTACYCFTKLLKPFSTRWRSLGHNCFIYIDDGISGHRTKSLAIIVSSRQKLDLSKAGFIFSEKCEWEPHQIGVWLGLIIDTIKFEFRIPDSKLEKLRLKLDHIIESRIATFRFIAKLAGFLQSLRLAVGPVIRLFTRQMYFTIANRTFWDDYAELSDSLLEELRFWRYNLSAFHGYSIRRTLSFDYVIFTDASNHAYGGFISNSNTTEAYGIWSEQEQGQSSTFRELKAIHNVIESYAPLLAHSKVKLFSDSQGACSIVDKGSPKLILHQLAIDIFVLALHNDVTLCPQWIPRSENERADIISGSQGRKTNVRILSVNF